jgi:hypothetical protein
MISTRSPFAAYDSQVDRPICLGIAGVSEVAVADQHIVQRIRSLRACGTTVPAIAQTLSAERIPTPSGGETWTRASVYRLLGPKTSKGTAETAANVTGALCRGRAPLFDDTVPGEKPAERRARLASAAELCAVCPARTNCPTPITSP